MSDYDDLYGAFTLLEERAPITCDVAAPRSGRAPRLRRLMPLAARRGSRCRRGHRRARDQVHGFGEPDPHRARRSIHPADPNRWTTSATAALSRGRPRGNRYA